LLFTLGYLYYFVVPIIVGYYGFFPGLPAMKIWFSIYNNIEINALISYLLIILSFYLAFITGSVLIKARKLKVKSIDLNFNKGSLKIFFYFSVALSMLFISRFRSDFFAGYSGKVSLNFAEKGPFIALSLVVLALAIIYAAKIHSIYGDNILPKKLFINKYFLFYFFIAILILSLGGRLYFISSIFIILIFYTVYVKPIKLMKAVWLGVLLILLMGSIGVLRGGDKQFSFVNALFNVFQEPLYTSFSLVSFLETSTFQALNVPKLLVGNFINLIPTFIFPNKILYINTPFEMGYTIYNPMGALNSYVSFMINFGFLGSILVFFFLGVFLEHLKTNKISVLSKTIYVMVSGFLAFTFFRDGFETSIVKNMFQFSILTPTFIILIAHIVSITVRNQKSG
jgi:hypothetical protein